MFVKLLCSCVLCRHEINQSNLAQHFNSKNCIEQQKQNQSMMCKYCMTDLSMLPYLKRMNHINWCEQRPDILQKNQLINDRLNKSWETDYDQRLKKMRDTKQFKYGDQNYTNPNKMRATKISNHGDAGYNNRDKAKETCIEKYGVDSVNKLPHIKEKIVNTCMIRYGVSTPLILKKNRPLDTNRHKATQTMIYRYGVENSAQSPELHAKMQSHRSTNKQFTFPSGKIVTIQGYEHIAIKELLDMGYDENDITVTNRKAIRYTYKGKESYYHPDIIISKENKIIEVKSQYWFDREYDKNIAKQKACLDQGYNFEFKIY